MPTLIKCPSCDRQLKVPDNLLGKNVKCPTCASTFVAAGAPEVSEPPPPPSEREPIEQAPASPSPQGEFHPPEDEYEEDRPRRRRRREYAPHRGGTILALGIISFFCFPIVLGPIAWIMGNNDLREIRAGRMDPAGEGNTNAGRICGMISTIIAACIMLLYCVIFVIAMAMPAMNR